MGKVLAMMLPGPWCAPQALFRPSAFPFFYFPSILTPNPLFKQVLVTIPCGKPVSQTFLGSLAVKELYL